MENLPIGENSKKIFNVDLGLLMLRLCTGILMIFHGFVKINNGHEYVIELSIAK